MIEFDSTIKPHHLDLTDHILVSNLLTSLRHHTPIKLDKDDVWPTAYAVLMLNACLKDTSLALTVEEAAALDNFVQGMQDAEWVTLPQDEPVIETACEKLYKALRLADSRYLTPRFHDNLPHSILTINERDAVVNLAVRLASHDGVTANDVDLGDLRSAHRKISIYAHDNLVPSAGEWSDQLLTIINALSLCWTMEIKFNKTFGEWDEGLYPMLHFVFDVAVENVGLGLANR